MRRVGPLRERCVSSRVVEIRRAKEEWRTAARRAGVVMLLVLAATSCGYHFQRSTDLPQGWRSLAIRTPANESTDPGVEFTVANALRREAMRRGGLRLVDDPGAADVVLSGRVLPIRTLGRAVSSVVLTLEYEITLSLDMDIWTRDGRQIPLDSRSLTETERYLASADVEVTLKNREEALRLVASTIASRIYDNLRTGTIQ